MPIIRSQEPTAAYSATSKIWRPTASTQKSLARHGRHSFSIFETCLPKSRYLTTIFGLVLSLPCSNMEDKSHDCVEALRLAFINLACHTHSLIRPLDRSSLLPLESKNTLGEFLARLRRISGVLLATSETVATAFSTSILYESTPPDFCLMCEWAAAELQSTFLLFKPVYSLWFALESRGTGLSRHSRRMIVVTGERDFEIDPIKFGGRKILVDVISTFEVRIHRVLLRMDEVAQSLENLGSL
jgi:hypothetical protein